MGASATRSRPRRGWDWRGFRCAPGADLHVVLDNYGTKLPQRGAGDRRPDDHLTFGQMSANVTTRCPHFMRSNDHEYHLDGAAGPMVETFVLMEIARQLTWSSERARLHHFRTKDKVEVDAILETPDGRVVAIEVKAGATVRVRQRLREEALLDPIDEHSRT